MITLMDESPPYRLDIGGTAGADEQSSQNPTSGARPWVGIRFDCCGVYTRVYRTRDGTAYRGQCPRCGHQVNLRVGPEGTNARFFAAE